MQARLALNSLAKVDLVLLICLPLPPSSWICREFASISLSSPDHGCLLLEADRKKKFKV